jgi:glycosyltransferase involved in cell wall biosynthesis
VDTAEFYPLPSDQRAALRDRIKLPADAFVVGMMAMNQGRKDFPRAIEGFCRAFRAVPGAYLYLDCDKNSPAGWKLPEWVLATFGLPPDRVRFREDALRAGIVSLNERYNLLDQHMVIAHREGFGLPHIEAMAAGVPSAALDYCSGREIVGEHGERGLLIRAQRGGLSTWGGAWDYDADVDDLAAQLRWSYEHSAERLALAARALAWARGRTWDQAGAAVEAVIRRVLASPPVPSPIAVGEG